MYLLRRQLFDSRRDQVRLGVRCRVAIGEHGVLSSEDYLVVDHEERSERVISCCPRLARQVDCLSRELFLVHDVMVGATLPVQYEAALQTKPDTSSERQNTSLCSMGGQPVCATVPRNSADGCVQVAS